MTSKGVISVCLLIVLLAGGAYVLSTPHEPGNIQAKLSVMQVLGGETDGYARAINALSTPTKATAVVSTCNTDVMVVLHG